MQKLNIVFKSNQTLGLTPTLTTNTDEKQ